MTDEKTPRLVLRENDAGEGGNDEGLRPEDDHLIAEFHDPADDVYDSSYEGPVTLVKALTGVNEVQLQQLQHESKTTLGQAGSPSNRSSSPFEFLPAQVVGSPVTRSFNPPSRRALPSLRSSIPAPTEASQDSSTSFRTRRAREGGNWFTGVRASKMLPPGFEPPEGLAESSPPRKSGSLRRPSSRSASLRSRKNRLPPGYAQPHEQPSLIVGYASVPGRGVVGERLHPGHRLTLLSPLDASPDRRVAAPLIPDPDEKVDKCISAPSGIPRRPPPDLTIDTTLSGALSGSGEVSMRESDFNEVMEDFDGSARPDLPPKSPDRPSDRNDEIDRLR
ncbi:hypothetical protein E8E12_002706 [Didymella heteroderae]|uniref:Uncharacterized protein n=1 Tax=Didymella heteroderae TaxID=1769908 RepID=A0A9P4WW84_9PLEO|nr:hypothetical protein E8E12_002706 [Didymella heteroderae]